MLTITSPPTYSPERQYIYAVLLGEFLGLDYITRIADGNWVTVTCQGDNSARSIMLPDILFQTPDRGWASPSTLPTFPLHEWIPPSTFAQPPQVPNRLPFIYSQPLYGNSFYEEKEGQIILGLDLFGSAFFMLTRYEEWVLPHRDRHGRFPGRASVAAQAGFLERPIVNEYVELLWACLKRLWSQLERKPRVSRVLPSHDVDWPYCAARMPWRWVLRNSAKDLLRHREPALAMRRAHSWLQTQYELDPCNTFDFMMDLSEQHGLRSAFYFIVDHTAGAVDGVYDIDEPWIQSLLHRIHERGHEVGLHASYYSYRDRDQIEFELKRLQQICSDLGISQAEWGGRQHFLRWESPITWQCWSGVGLNYDSTLTFHDQVGFRCGVCYEYPVFDLHQRRQLALRERPLIVMDVTLLSPAYMRLNFRDILNKISDLYYICKAFHGDFTFLWHNSRLISENEKELYKNIIGRLL